MKNEISLLKKEKVNIKLILLTYLNILKLTAGWLQKNKKKTFKKVGTIKYRPDMCPVHRTDSWKLSKVILLSLD